MTYPVEFYGLEERDWFDATGEFKPTGYAYGDRYRPIYVRRSDKVRGWFPNVGSRFVPLPPADHTRRLGPC